MNFASATPLHKEVVREMTAAMKGFGNPSSPHEEGRAAKALLESARARIARALFARPEALIFTGSGTESNNLAITGFVEALAARGASYQSLHIAVSALEHPSVLEPVRALEKKGVTVSFIQPDGDGIISPEAVAKSVRPETVLVSVGAVQGEIGQVQPIKDIARALEVFRENFSQKNQDLVPECPLPILHSDASQGPLFVDVAPERLGASVVTYDAQKIMGPKGIGLLYKHSSVPLEPLIRGGSQERGVRAGTENVAGAVGMARAFELALKGREERTKRALRVRDHLARLLKEEMPDVVINGGMKRRIANNIHISVPNADGDYLAVLMDKEGIAVSPRSACIAAGTPSGAVVALQSGGEYEQGTLRFSLNPNATKEDVARAASALKRCRQIIDSL